MGTLQIFLPYDAPSGALPGWWLWDGCCLVADAPAVEPLGILLEGRPPKLKPQQGQQPKAVQVVYYDRLLPSQRWTSGRAEHRADRGLPAVLARLDALSPKQAGRAPCIPPGLCRCLSWLASLALPGSAMATHGRSALLTQLEARLRMLSEWCPERCQEGGQQRLWMEFSVAVCCFDHLVGFILMFFIRWHWASLLQQLIFVGRWAYRDQLAAMVPWLMGAPADFKLNRELTSFAGSLFLSMFSLWDVQVPPAAAEFLAQAAPVVVCGCAMMGGSFLLSLLMDLLAMASLPLFVAYLGTCLCWRMACKSLYSLCLLFQGSKFNILRSRVDHHNFSMDQLLIGVILLSIVVFLLPSLFMFYLCFTAAWLLVLLLHGTLGLLVVLCNEQPICWMLLAQLRRWHHGPVVEVLEQVSGEGQEPSGVPHLYLRLKLRPARVGDSFQPMAAACWAYVQRLMGPGAGAGAVICGHVWPIRSPMVFERRLPKAASLS